jgi:DNA-binding NtrC family response regulator
MEERFDILVVDDDLNLSSNLQDILEAEGYRTAVALNAETALALCREKIFGLAIVDIYLPDISGIELTKELTSLLPEMTFIIMTGYASLDSAIIASRRRDIVAYLTKPVNIDNLLSLIRVARDSVSRQKK